MKVFVFGLGYTALASIEAMRNTRGDVAVEGTTRNAQKAAALRERGIAAQVFSGAEPGPGVDAALAGATHVIQSIAPDGDGDAALTHHGAALARSDTLEWVCYYSTVGVYGDFGGAWIDETAPCQPTNARSLWRLAAEERWRAFADQRGVPLAILRLAGIYGPGRSGLDKLRDGTARRIVKPGQVFNRIHVDDIAQITARAALARLDGIYNVADDEPAPPQDVVAHGANLLGMAPPPEVAFADAALSPMARSFYGDNKRVSNARIKQALGIGMIHPSYREGLAAIAGRASDPISPRRDG